MGVRISLGAPAFRINTIKSILDILMKVYEILFEQDEESTWQISEDDMEIVFQAMKNKPELHVRDINGLAHEIIDETEYSRSPGSAKFLIQRMHVIIHGIAPHGASERTAATWMVPARPLLDFMANKGYKPEERIRQARIELKGRKPKITQEQATQMMSDAARGLDPEQRRLLSPMRNELIADIMAGLTPQEAFARRL